MSNQALRVCVFGDQSFIFVQLRTIILNGNCSKHHSVGQLHWNTTGTLLTRVAIKTILNIDYLTVYVWIYSLCTTWKQQYKKAPKIFQQAYLRLLVCLNRRYSTDNGKKTGKKSSHLRGWNQRIWDFLPDKHKSLILVADCMSVVIMIQLRQQVLS